MGGGLVGDIANKIFTPRDGVAGAPKLFYVRAATTTAASITLTFSSGNTIVLKCKNEGLCGNGIAVSDVLKVGYAAKVIAGETSGKFKLQIFKGGYMGSDDAGEAPPSCDVTACCSCRDLRQRARGQHSCSC